MLGNSIALIAVAALFGVEAYKATERLPRLILAALAIVSALWAAFVNQIAAAAPKAGNYVTQIFQQPESWFMLATALFFVLRPFWNHTLGQPTSALRDTATEAPRHDPRTDDNAQALGSAVALLGQRLDRLEATSVSQIGRAMAALEGIQERLKKIEPAVRLAENMDRRERARTALAPLQNMKMQQRPSKIVSSKWPQNEQSIGYAVMALTGLGVDGEHIVKKRQEIEDRIKADAQYLQFNAEDAEVWLDANEKRRYLIQCEQFAALMKMLKGIAGVPDPTN